MTDNRQSLSADLASKIRIDILSEELRNGEKITEQALSERYKVSRTPIREALKNLETEGLIEMIPNRGAFVRGLSVDDFRDLYTLRKVYEVQAICWAVERATKTDIENIEESLDFMAFLTYALTYPLYPPFSSAISALFSYISLKHMFCTTLIKMQVREPFLFFSNNPTT